MLMPTSLGLLLPAFPPEQRGVAIGIWAAVGGVAAARRARRSAACWSRSSWRWVFLVNVPIGIVAAIAALRVLREARDPRTAGPDLLGAALLAARDRRCSRSAIVKGPDWGWGTRASSRCSPPRPAWSSRSCAARPATPRR